MTRKQKKSLRRIILSAVLYVLLLIIGAKDRGWLGLALFLIPYAVIGWDVLWRAVRNIRNGQVFDEKFLLAGAPGGAFGCGGESAGVAAMLVADPEAEEEVNTAAMTEAFQKVRTSEITYAARDSDFDGFAIHQGDYLALEEHQLFGTDRKLEKLLRRLADFLTALLFPVKRLDNHAAAHALLHAAGQPAQGPLASGRSL